LAVAENHTVNVLTCL